MSQNRCRFVEVVERSQKCPCDCVPPIPLGPPCPFKSKGEPFGNNLLGMLSESQKRDCPLAEKSQGLPENDKLCVFSQSGPIDFKSWPRFACSCVPGTCPELAKNVIRSLGFDPMCSCPCPKTLKTLTLPEEPKKTKRKKDRSKSRLDLSKSESKRQDKQPTTASSIAAETQPGLPSAVQPASAIGAPTNAAKPSNTTADSGDSNGSLLLEGKGFKIYDIDGEKVLFNYSTRNCRLLKCKCSRKDEGSCGCTEWVRISKYNNCICPGARKAKKAPPSIKYVGDNHEKLSVTSNL